MHLSYLLTEQIGSMFIMLFFGVILVRSRLLKSEDSKKLSTVLLYVIIPCTIISAFQITYTKEKLAGLGIAFLGAVIVHLLYIIITILANKIFHLKLIEQASLIYSNAGNLIIPLVGAVLGKEWVIYCCAYVVVQTFLVWSHGKSLICGVKKLDLKKILLNINVIAIFIGVILFLTRLPIPMFIQTSLESTGSMIGPLSMIVMGMLIGDMNMKDVFSNKRTYLICLGRLVIYPVLVTLIFCFSGIAGLHPEAQQILLVVLLAAAAPVAATVTQLAQVYDRDSGYSSIINVMSILFCIITMPAVVMLYEFLI